MNEISSIPRLPPRAADSHKGDYGRLLLVAGSRGMTGAAVLAARASLRSGVGLATTAIPGAQSPALTAAVPETTQLLLADEETDDGAAQLALSIADDARPFSAAAIGPGLGRSERARATVEWVLSDFDRPHVVDADALNIVAEHTELASFQRDDRVWTPHPGEFQRLSGDLPRGDEARLRAAEAFVAKRGGVLVLKGHRTVVTDGERFHLVTTGNPGMATGGTGDVLTGIVGALLAQGLDAFDAAVLAAHVHGLAGDLARDRFGDTSLVAGDIVDALPAAFLQLPSGGEATSPAEAARATDKAGAE